MIYSPAESTPFLSAIGLNERTFQAHHNGSKMRAQSRTHLAQLFVSQKEIKASMEAFFFFENEGLQVGDFLFSNGYF